MMFLVLLMLNKLLAKICSRISVTSAIVARLRSSAKTIARRLEAAGITAAYKRLCPSWPLKCGCLMPKRKIAGGMTIVEVLVALGLSAMVMCCAAELTLAAYKSHITASNSVSGFRQTVNALDIISRDLRMCRSVVRPAKLTSKISLNPRKGGGAFLFRQCGKTDRVAGFFLNSKGELRQYAYKKGVVPSSNLRSGLIRDRLICSGVTAINISFPDKSSRNGAYYASVELYHSDSTSPFVTEVMVRGL